MADDDYQFDDVDVTASLDSASSTEEAAPSAEEAAPSTSSPAPTGGGGYATELYSKQIKAKFRTFFVDLKESSNGKFIKISEKSHGRKSTIMMDAEDVPTFIEALKEIQEHL